MTGGSPGNFWTGPSGGNDPSTCRLSELNSAPAPIHPWAKEGTWGAQLCMAKELIVLFLQSQANFTFFSRRET